MKKSNRMKIAATAELPTRSGRFQIVAFGEAEDGKEHVALVKGAVQGEERVPTRLHSQCLTGDTFGSLRCDCQDQLIRALETIERSPSGIVLYLRQEGRGIGLVNKIKAYALQDRGHDTYEADQLLGFSGDEREYDIAAQMLQLLGVRSVELMTNNPRKIDGLRKFGIRVEKRIPHFAAATEHNRAYLETKRRKAGHWTSTGESSLKQGEPLQ